MYAYSRITFTSQPISRKGSFSFDLDGANDLLIHRREYFGKPDNMYY